MWRLLHAGPVECYLTDAMHMPVFNVISSASGPTSARIHCTLLSGASLAITSEIDPFTFSNASLDCLAKKYEASCLKSTKVPARRQHRALIDDAAPSVASSMMTFAFCNGGSLFPRLRIC